ncbi:uncharacterized protein LOC114290539 isoform X3 [Camellia sinensis]|uniref:uncharacterized protein LOC114290539 isoform X3 n=2 Tax=Camellia sinensis TaxID=4442 RepID=UPI0010369999|nr:uncharacterized protein LOC114290539 isoform X3 [Camellia sinensis]
MWYPLSKGISTASFFLNILKSLAVAYGQMILKSGFFHADPHPGNILICKGSEASRQPNFTTVLESTDTDTRYGYDTIRVALLDYGQVKDLPDNLRLGNANLVIAIADKDPVRASESYRELGTHTLIKCEDGQKEMLKLAQTMFDTKLQPGVKMLQPFSEESSIKKIAVQAFPEELFSVLRMVHLLRGLSVGLGINYSCAEQWRPIAEETLYLAGRLKGGINNRTHLSSGGDGAILVFLTGWDDISKLLEKIKANSLLRDPSKFLVLPLHSSMPTINQCEIFDRPHANVRYPSFLLRFYLLGMMVEFVKNVADFAAASGKKHIVVLSSLDFGRWQTIDMSSGLHIYYLSSASMDGTDDDCERLGWKRLQEYNPEQRLWKYLSTLAEGNAELDDNMAFEDELGEEDYYPSLPFAALFSCFKAKGLKVTCLLCYCSEGDNIPEAFHLADAACSLLGLNPNNFQGNEGSKWIVPFSWQTVYGPPPDRSLF